MNRTHEVAFVDYVINIITHDKGAAANLRRADNPKTEYQAWEYLSAFNIDLSKDYQRLSFALIAAALSKAKIERNGSFGIGSALANCEKDGANNSQLSAKLRRLLACDSVEELVRILRPLLTFIHSKSTVSLNYSSLLENMIDFYWNGDRVKANWAQDFYGRNRETSEEEVSP